MSARRRADGDLRPLQGADRILFPVATARLERGERAARVLDPVAPPPSRRIERVAQNRRRPIFSPLLGARFSATFRVHYERRGVPVRIADRRFVPVDEGVSRPIEENLTHPEIAMEWSVLRGAKRRRHRLEPAPQRVGSGREGGSPNAQVAEHAPREVGVIDVGATRPAE